VFTYVGDAGKIDDAKVRWSGEGADMTRMRRRTSWPLRADWNKLRWRYRARRCVPGRLGRGAAETDHREPEERREGLADDKVIKGELARLAKERKLEVHVCLRNVALFRKDKEPEAVKG